MLKQKKICTCQSSLVIYQTTIIFSHRVIAENVTQSYKFFLSFALQHSGGRDISCVIISFCLLPEQHIAILVS